MSEIDPLRKIGMPTALMHSECSPCPHCGSDLNEFLTDATGVVMTCESCGKDCEMVGDEHVGLRTPQDVEYLKSVCRLVHLPDGAWKYTSENGNETVVIYPQQAEGE